MSYAVAGGRGALLRCMGSASKGLGLHGLGGCCSSWLMRALRHQRSYLTTTTSTSSSSETALSKGVVLPSLFLTTSSSSTYTRRCLYDVFDQEKEKKKKNISTSGMIHLPREMDLHLIIGSSDGFLFTFDRCTQEIYAINPLTDSRLLLPSTASIPNMIGVLRNATSDEVTHYVIQDDEPRIERYLYEGKGKGKGKGKESNINSFLFQRVDPTSTTDAHKLMHKYDYYEKAILSPSLDTAVVIRELDTDSERQLAFAPVGLQQTSPDHSFWTPLHKSTKSPVTEGFLDIIFHQGRLHALDKSGSLTIFDLDNPSSPPLYRSPAGKPLEKEEGKYGHENGYLVESPDGRDLFVVYRGILQYDKDDMCTPPRTNTFKVFKLDTRSSDYFSKWERVESIGDLAFFLGCNRSSSLSTLDFPPGHVKPNSIYFTDTCYTGDYEDEIGDTGVFSLDDGNFEFYPINDENHKFNETRPVWLMPPAIGSS